VRLCAAAIINSELRPPARHIEADGPQPPTHSSCCARAARYLVPHQEPPPPKSVPAAAQGTGAARNKVDKALAGAA